MRNAFGQLTSFSHILMAADPDGMVFVANGPTIIEELVAQMPEDAQAHVVEFLLEAQAQLLEKYNAELDEVASQM